jgi:hypothetical protein
MGYRCEAIFIGEFVKDADKRWRYAKLTSAVTAILAQEMWAQKVSRERDDYRDRYEGRG